MRAGSRWTLESSRLLAAERAGVMLSDKGRTYFQALELYPDLTTYNAAQLSGLGDPEAVYPTGAGWDWRWESEAAWRRYRRMRRDARRMKNWATLSLGGVVAGRLAGAATALIAGIRDREGVTPAGSAGDAAAGGFSIRIEPWYEGDQLCLTGFRIRIRRYP